MGTHTQRGFTIIEVTLFMALTGLLAILLLGGWTTMINTQRYRDSANSLQSFLQQQYNLVYNVENGRDDALACVDGSVDDTKSTPRGQTDCLIIGRVITLDADGKAVAETITGKEVTSSAANDLSDFKLRNLTKVSQQIGLSDNSFTIPWGTTVVTPANASTPRQHVIAIVRSPMTGTVHTYRAAFNTGDSVPTIQTLLDNANEQNDTPICLDPGTFVASASLAVKIDRYATSQDGIRVTEGTDAGC